MLSLIWFQNQEEPLLIRRNQSTERSDFLKCVVLVDVRQFECTDKRSQPLRSKSTISIFLNLNILGTYLSGLFSINVISFRWARND